MTTFFSLKYRQSTNSRKDSLIEVSIPLAEATDISVVINKTTPFDHLKTILNYTVMYPVDTDPSPTLIPELYGHIIKGKLLDSVIDTAEVFFLTVHGIQSHMFIDKPNEKGDLYFDTGNFSYYEYAIIQSTQAGQQVNFILTSPFWEKVPAENFQLPVLKLSFNDEKFIREKILERASHQYYLGPIEIPKTPLPFQYIMAYGKVIDHFPDFRSTLTWQTNKETNENGNLTFSFKPSLLKGRYVLRIQYRDSLNNALKIAQFSMEMD